MKLEPYIHNESYEYEYGNLNYEGKKVLDLGAEYGSSAEFFLEKGANEVIAVEGNKTLYEQLVENCKWLKNITPIFLFLKEPSHVEELIEKYKPDVVKSDLDGHEIHLLRASDKIISSVKEYIMEIHSMQLLKMCLEKFLKNGYQITEFKRLSEKKVKDEIFGDGTLISFVKPSNSHYYFYSMDILFKYWELSKKKG